MPLIGELINNLAQKAGIQSDNADLKALLSSPELAAINVPDEVATIIDKNLMSLDAAKNNHPEVRNKYWKDFHDGIDKRLIPLLENDILEPEDIEEIKNEITTGKKIELAINKLKAAKLKARPADKEEINKLLAAANEEARLAKLEAGKVKDEYENKIKNIRKDTALNAELSSYKTIYDDLPTKAKVVALKALIESTLQEKKAEFRTDQDGNLQIMHQDGTNVFGSDNVLLTHKSFLDQTLAPILKVSVSPKTDHSQIRQTNTVDTTNKGDASISTIKNHNAQVLADLARPSNALI